MRHHGIAVLALLIGLALGVTVALIYAWQINPIIQTDVQPFQLSRQAKQNYAIVLSMAYRKDRDIVTAARRLSSLNMNWQDVANIACDLVQSGNAKTNTDILVIRTMVELAASQGKSACASALIPQNTPTVPPTATGVPPTDTRVPPASKTPRATLDVTFTPEAILPVLTPTPSGDFQVIAPVPVCDPNLPGVIQIFVQDAAGVGIPGVKIEVSATGKKDTFFTGLKPDVDNGFADFQMTDGDSYTITLPDLNSRTSKPITTGSCNATNGGTAQLSYRLVFRKLLSKTP